MRFGLALAALLLGGVWISSPARADESFYRIPTRGDVTESFVFDMPDAPKAAAILFPGGEGSIGVDVGASRVKKPGNFLIRSRDKFAALGVAAVGLDAPSDHDDGIDESFRIGADHAKDAAAVVAWLRQKVNAPVWLIGTSMGTISAANVAIRLGKSVDGLVLTSSVSAPSNARHGSNGVFGLDLRAIAVPTFVMDHVNEACPVSPAENAKVIAKQLSNSPRVDVQYIEGGLTPKSAPCEPFSYHGYYGVEDKAVAAIVAFMLAK